VFIFLFLVEEVVGFDASAVIIQLAIVLDRWINTRGGRLAVGRLVANWLAAVTLLRDVGKVMAVREGID
jgi:predicted Kef-type K+ transport protein